MINVLIVDDEPLALDILETYIEQMPDLRLIDRCESAREAQEVLNNEKVDLMFLDIQISSPYTFLLKMGMLSVLKNWR